MAVKQNDLLLKLRYKMNRERNLAEMFRCSKTRISTLKNEVVRDLYELNANSEYLWQFLLNQVTLEMVQRVIEGETAWNTSRLQAEDIWNVDHTKRFWRASSLIKDEGIKAEYMESKQRVIIVHSIGQSE